MNEVELEIKRMPSLAVTKKRHEPNDDDSDEKGEDERQMKMTKVTFRRLRSRGSGVRSMKRCNRGYSKGVSSMAMVRYPRTVGEAVSGCWSITRNSIFHLGSNSRRNIGTFMRVHNQSTRHRLCLVENKRGEGMLDTVKNETGVSGARRVGLFFCFDSTSHDHTTFTLQSMTGLPNKQGDKARHEFI
jgi:hypothetical protein